MWTARNAQVNKCKSTCRFTSVLYSFCEKVDGMNIHATIPKGNIGYDQYTVPDTVAAEPTFLALL